MTSDTWIPVAFALAAAVCFGAGAPLSKMLMMGVEPLAFAALLYIGAGSGMSLYFLLTEVSGHGRGGMEAPLSWEDWPMLTLSILFGSILPTTTLMVSLTLTPALTASLLLSFEAVVTTLVAATIFHEPVGGRVWAALALITIGCMALSYSSGSEFGFSWGALGVLLSCVFWGFEVNVNRALSGKDPVRIVVIKGWIAGVAMTVIAMLLGAPFPGASTMVTAMVVGFTSFGGLIVICFFRALRELGSARTGAIFGINPLFGILISLVVLREVPTILVVVAAPLMFVGLFLMLSERHHHTHHHTQEEHEHRHRHGDLHHDHLHGTDDPPADRGGYHSHHHIHKKITHDHSHHPDIHHRHRHDKQ